MNPNAELELELSQLIRTSAVEIVREVIAKAKQGSYLHAKFLFDLAGLDLTGGGESAEGAESLAAYLLRELKEPSAQT